MASLPSGAPAIPDRPAQPLVDLTRIPIQPWALLNEFEAAALIGLPVKRLRKHRVLGVGPQYVKIGATVRYTPTSLLNYIASLPTGGNGVSAATLKKRNMGSK